MLLHVFHDVLFSFAKGRRLRYLHSFPTRRSSDLAYLADVTGNGKIDASDTLAANNVAIGAASRSEEHTSELQSHSDLVCRLLLEKKIAEVTSMCPGIPVKKIAEGATPKPLK